jgi:hypothetical protein
MIRLSGKVDGMGPTISAIAQIPSLLRQGFIKAMTQGLEDISEVTRRDYLSGPYPTHLQPRTQRLRASMRRSDRDNIFRVDARETTVIGELGTQVIYGRIHEVGGVIRPKHGLYLAIRTEFTKTGGGVVRPQYRGPLRLVPNTFVRRTSTGSLGVFQRIGQRVMAIAWLVKQVTIPARPYLGPGVQKAFPRVVARFQAVVDAISRAATETLRRR